MVEVFLFPQEQLGLHRLGDFAVLICAIVQRRRQDLSLILEKPGGELTAFLFRELEELLFDFGEAHAADFTFARPVCERKGGARRSLKPEGLVGN